MLSVAKHRNAPRHYRSLRPPPLRPFDKLRVLPSAPKFVELALCRACRTIETHPEITAAFVPAPSTLRQAQGPSLPAPKFVEPVETNPEITAAFVPPLRPFDTLRVLPSSPSSLSLSKHRNAPRHHRSLHPTPATFRPFDTLRDRQLKVLPPCLPVRIVSRDEGRTRGVPHRRPDRGKPSHPSLSARPPCGPGVARLCLHRLSPRRRERVTRAKGQATLKGRREGRHPFLDI